MSITKRFGIGICGLIAAGVAVSVSLSFAGEPCKAIYGKGPHRFTVATGSPGELGLLRVLADQFNARHPTSICWQKAGSGKSLRLLQRKEADVIMVHAPSAERKAVAAGWAGKRTLIGSNEFFIVGPKDDPAGIAKAKSAVEAYSKIAKSRSLFLSRGDNSGTHKKEMSIWSKAGIRPSGKWYMITRDFMLATLKKANQERGYFMVDSSTWVAAGGALHNIAVLFKGDPALVNVYHALCQPEASTDGEPYASRFIDFLASEGAQKTIREYGMSLYGQPLYHDAIYASRYEPPRKALPPGQP